MIITISDLAQVRDENQHKRIVLACGTFDILHAGHVEYLEWARSQGDILVVCTPNDASIKEEKGPSRPINNERDRLKVLDSLRMVNYVVLSDKYHQAVQDVSMLLHPDIIVVYKDWDKERVAELVRLFPDAEVLVDNSEKLNSSSVLASKL